MYIVIKKDQEGEVFHTICPDDEELVRHLDATFKFTKIKIIGVINLGKKQVATVAELVDADQVQSQSGLASNLNMTALFRHEKSQ